MKQIRNHVFETNSSSVHTISISNEGLEPSKLRMNKDGKVVVPFGSFDSDYRIYNSQEEKLSYLLTQCAYLYCLWSDKWIDEFNNKDIKMFYENHKFKCIEHAIVDYVPNCTGIVIEEPYSAYIDHQSVPEDEDDLMCCIWDKQSVQGFVFNKYVSLKTDCD